MIPESAEDKALREVGQRVEQLVRDAGIDNTEGVSPPRGASLAWSLMLTFGRNNDRAHIALRRTPGVSNVRDSHLGGGSIVLFDLDPSLLPEARTFPSGASN